jgi:hypothetical protein
LSHAALRNGYILVVMLTVVTPEGRQETFRFHDSTNVHVAAGDGARLLGLEPLGWALVRDGRVLDGALSLRDAGARDGDRLELRHQ